MRSSLCLVFVIPLCFPGIVLGMDMKPAGPSRIQSRSRTTDVDYKLRPRTTVFPSWIKEIQSCMNGQTTPRLSTSEDTGILPDTMTNSAFNTTYFPSQKFYNSTRTKRSHDQTESAVISMSSLGTCQRRRALITLSHPGCSRKRIIATGCFGSCHSWAMPEWHFEKQEMDIVDYCTCCEPREVVTRRVRLRCEGSTRYASVALAVECACRPCSPYETPEAEQPYDY